MNKPYLLTYHIKNGSFDFEWFDTEEELRERVKIVKQHAAIVDAIHIKDVEAIELE